AGPGSSAPSARQIPSKRPVVRHTNPDIDPPQRAAAWSPAKPELISNGGGGRAEGSASAGLRIGCRRRRRGRGLALHGIAVLDLVDAHLLVELVEHLLALGLDLGLLAVDALDLHVPARVGDRRAGLLEAGEERVDAREV